jgi:hypothetical protein
LFVVHPQWNTRATDTAARIVATYLRTLFSGEAYWMVYVVVSLFSAPLIFGVARFAEATRKLGRSGG